jgi:peptidoglycan hydrolase-like protein with peptidoglycan-binding domain
VNPVPKRRRTVLLGGAVLVTVAVAVAATLGLGGRDPGAAAPSRTGPAKTVPVTRQTLTDTVSLAGTLSYGTATPLTSTATGTVTWLAEVGVTVRRGGVLLRADEQPIVLLYGTLPMYRTLAEGLQGGDVRQFEQNLAALGYAGFTVDDTFSASTTAAVKRWQKDLAVAVTGTVDRAQVIYAPDAVRIARRLVRVGASATGDVLAFTGNTKLVTVPADPGRVGWAVKDVKVTVTLPDGASTGGVVTGVATATVQAATGQGASDGANPGTGGATIQVTVAIADQKALGGLAEAPVDVRYVAHERKDVLTVPVDALLALREGGYGLEVVDGAGSRVVRVEAGLFAGGRVEVSGDGVTEGLPVGVAE